MWQAKYTNIVFVVYEGCLDPAFDHCIQLRQIEGVQKAGD
jgi:hypothetical protein